MHRVDPNPNVNTIRGAGGDQLRVIRCIFDVGGIQEVHWGVGFGEHRIVVQMDRLVPHAAGAGQGKARPIGYPTVFRQSRAPRRDEEIRPIAQRDTRTDRKSDGRQDRDIEVIREFRF